MQEKKRILIVDDEFAIRELIALTLEPEYEIIKADNGEEALQVVEKIKPDLIILDVMMPRIDGYRVCKELKENENTKKIPIIMLTAKHLAEDIEQAVLVDVDEYITKPFEPEMLKKRVDYYFSGERNDERKILNYDKSIHYIKGKQEVQTQLDELNLKEEEIK